MPDRKRSLFSTLVLLAIPTVLEEILSTLLQYVDTAMVGQLGEKATASVSVTQTVSWLIGSIPAALSVGVIALIARAVGSGDGERIRKMAGQTVLLVLGSGVVIGAACAALSPFIPVWMGAAKDIRADASRYFFIVTAPMVFRTSAILFGAAIRATADTKTPMLINFAANGLNAGLNWLLIYGLSLGVTGAAIATAISYTLAGVLMAVAFRRNALLRGKLLPFKPDKALLKECFTISVPVLLTSVANCLGHVVFASLVTNMGTTVFAAHSIAISAETLFYIAGYGLRSATQTLVGISLGERNRAKFASVCRLSVLLTVLMMAVSGVTLYAAAGPLMSVFTSSAEVARLGAVVLRMVAFSEPFFGLMIVMEGVYYGLGQTRNVFWSETACMWGIRILFTSLCVHLWHTDLETVWLCMIIDNVARALLLCAPLAFRKFRTGLFPAAQEPLEETAV